MQAGILTIHIFGTAHKMEWLGGRLVTASARANERSDFHVVLQMQQQQAERRTTVVKILVRTFLPHHQLPRGHVDDWRVPTQTSNTLSLEDCPCIGGRCIAMRGGIEQLCRICLAEYACRIVSVAECGVRRGKFDAWRHGMWQFRRVAVSERGVSGGGSCNGGG